MGHNFSAIIIRHNYGKKWQTFEKLDMLSCQGSFNCAVGRHRPRTLLTRHPHLAHRCRMTAKKDSGSICAKRFFGKILNFKMMFKTSNEQFQDSCINMMNSSTDLSEINFRICLLRISDGSLPDPGSRRLVSAARSLSLSGRLSTAGRTAGARDL